MPNIDIITAGFIERERKYHEAVSITGRSPRVVAKGMRLMAEISSRGWVHFDDIYNEWRRRKIYGKWTRGLVVYPSGYRRF